MKKFVCGHCSARIAVTPRNLGKLVVCPECGKTTHPLAADILASARDGPPAQRALSADPVGRKCENCGRTIGRLEKLQVWENHLVCDGCHAQLMPAQPPGKKETVVIATSAGPATLLPARVEATDPGDGMIPLRVAAKRVALNPFTFPMLPARQRLTVLLIVASITGAALYGALTLLRDLAGALATVAIVLLAVVIAIAVGGAAYRILRKRWPLMPRRDRASEDSLDLIVRRD